MVPLGRPIAVFVQHAVAGRATAAGAEALAALCSARPELPPVEDGRVWPAPRGGPALPTPATHAILR